MQSIVFSWWWSWPLWMAIVFQLCAVLYLCLTPLLLCCRVILAADVGAVSWLDKEHNWLATAPWPKTENGREWKYWLILFSFLIQSSLYKRIQLCTVLFLASSMVGANASPLLTRSPAEHGFTQWKRRLRGGFQGYGKLGTQCGSEATGISNAKLSNGSQGMCNLWIR